MNSKLPPINKRISIQKKQIKEEKIKENIHKANDNWNNWKFHLHRKNIEWVDLKAQERNKNEFCYSTHKLYIKDWKESFHFVGRSRLKLVDYDTIFNSKELIAALTEIIVYIKSTEKNNHDSTIFFTSVKNISDEVSGKIAAVNEPQENEFNSDAIFVDQASLSYKKSWN